MRRVFYLSLINCMIILNIYAAQMDKIVKNVEDIRYLSQKIANDYLYLYMNPKNKDIKDRIENSIKKLENDFIYIAKSSNDVDTKNVLDFLSYSKDQIKELIKNDISKEGIYSILDISNSLLEGANSIYNNHKINIKFHLMKSSKIYMLKNLNLSSENSNDKLNQEIKVIDHSLKTDLSWLSYKELLNRDRSFTPYILELLMQDLQNRITQR